MNKLNGTIAILLFVLSGHTIIAQTDVLALRVNQDRIERRIHELAQFGRDSTGHGYRVAYTSGDIAGRAWYMEQMSQAGLDVSIDAAGNLVGKRAGMNPGLKPIAFGSHIDMVPDGGNYDGCVGSISALEVMDVLKENNLKTNHPLEILIFSNEEGATYGSSFMAGHLHSEVLNNVSQSGLNLYDGIKAIGGDPDHIQNAVRQKGDLAAFLELHIEQGAFLERDQIQIGVVSGIVGILQWDVTITGMANHAGTTPMNLRHDALLAAAKYIQSVNDVITSHEGTQVGTVGKISVQPGAYNVIPGQVITSLEIRDLSSDKIMMLFHEIEGRAAEIAKSSGVSITFKKVIGTTPALTDKGIQDKIIASAQKLNLTYQVMPSGAGHDSQEIATIAPVGMIFVPSVKGISHSPDEYTKPEDMANGANVLLQTILALDRK
ncbi:MAG: Zn-dependent hydrolase [Lewinellaceae bacterium]|nr:Zn-dependent hydrolase [Lewinellaceae bacterium]